MYICIYIFMKSNIYIYADMNMQRGVKIMECTLHKTDWSAFAIY